MSPPGLCSPSLGKMSVIVRQSPINTQIWYQWRLKHPTRRWAKLTHQRSSETKRKGEVWLGERERDTKHSIMWREGKLSTKNPSAFSVRSRATLLALYMRNGSIDKPLLVVNVSSFQCLLERDLPLRCRIWAGEKKWTVIIWMFWLVNHYLISL